MILICDGVCSVGEEGEDEGEDGRAGDRGDVVAGEGPGAMLALCVLARGRGWSVAWGRPAGARARGSVVRVGRRTGSLLRACTFLIDGCG